MIRQSLSLFALLALLSSACSFSPKAPPVESILQDDYSIIVEYLQSYIPSQMKKYQLTGLSVALVDDQQIEWTNGFGYADAEAGISSTAATQYQAGSVSKLFTAMAVMKLQQDNKVDLDEPIKNLVPEFDLKSRFLNTDDITLRNILSHHAGIPGNIIDGMWANDPDSYKSVTSRLSRYYAAYPPNTVSAYSNAGYSVAGHAVENASGTPFSRYVADSLLKPLEMENSNFEFDSSGGKFSKSYHQGDEVETLGLRDIPAGGLVTTVIDMSNLIKLVNANGVYKTRLFNPATMKEMLTIQTYDSVYEPDGFNGLGWFHLPRFLDNAHTVVGHTGQTMSHSALLAVAPELKLGVVLLSNSPSNGGLETIADEIMDLAYAVRTGQELVVADKNRIKPLPGIEADFEGKYASNFGLIKINRSGQKYNVSVGKQNFRLSKNPFDGGYSLRVQFLGFIPIKPPGLGDLSFFAREVSGTKLLFTHRSHGLTSLAASELESQERNPVWDARLGTYLLKNPFDTNLDIFKVKSATLVYEDGLYQLEVSGSPSNNQQLLLKVLNETEATLQGYGRGLGETVLFQPDGSMLHAGWVFSRSRDQ